LRRRKTNAERKLWFALRARLFAGFKFRRQQPIRPYIADFACFEAMPVIELDGGQHGLDQAIAYDNPHTCMEKQGFAYCDFPTMKSIAILAQCAMPSRITCAILLPLPL